MRILTALALVLAAGCTGDLTDLGPAGKGTGGSGGAPSGGGGAGGTGGSGGAAPMNVTFADIQADFDAKICTNSGCHGAATVPGGAVFLITPMATGAALATNYANTKNEINTDAGNQANSLILTKNLAVAAGGVNHTGGNTTFASTTDPLYLKWLNWIKAGAPQQ
jgi:hypothetical protein